MLIIASALLPALTFPVLATTWTGPTQITNTSLLHYSPRTVQDQAGNVYLFWDQNPGIYYIVTTTGQIASNTWPAPVQYTKSGNNQDVGPAPVALKNGTLIMFFSSKRANGYNVYFSRYNNGVWSPETSLTSITTANQNPTAVQDNTGKIWVAWTRAETGDIKIKFVDLCPANALPPPCPNGTSAPDGVWDPGEPIVYDSNGNGMYDAGEPVIAGTAPATGTSLTVDPRIGFIDANGNNVWDPGEFVLYDPNLDSTYDPRLMFVDSNNNNVWDPGESIVYKANSTATGFTGTGQCRGSIAPAADCVIIGSVPAQTTILRIDSRIKFVDLNSDGLWEPGETLVYDVNNNGQYASNDIAIAALTPDSKLRFIGPGSTWAPGNTVVYDANGNSQYDGGIMFVDDNFTNHWVTGDTVVYHKGSVNTYNGLTDTLITGTTDDSGKVLKNDPALRFVDANANGAWDPGESVVYDHNFNGIYDGKLMFVNATTSSSETWAAGKAVVYDADGDGRYIVGKYVTVNDTIITGTVANNTALGLDPKVKFYDSNGNTLWDNGESVLYDSNNNNLYDTGEPVIAGASPISGVGLTTGLGEQLIVPASPPLGYPLINDPKLHYVRTGTNTTWVPGEAVVYDTDGNGLYGSGKIDTHVRFVNATTSSSETWAAGKAVVYDADGDGRYIVGKYVTVNDTIITGTVANNTAVKIDTKLDFVDCTTATCDNNNRWESGEAIFYDANGNGVYNTGETIIVGTAPPAEPVILGRPPALGVSLSTDTLVRFWDSDGNVVWDSAEAVVYDALNKRSFQPDYYQYDLIRGIAPQAATILAYNVGEPWLAGPQPTPGTVLSPYDPKIEFVDLNGNGHWDRGGVLTSQISTGEPVEYDTNNNGVYDVGIDVIISGSPVPSIRTILKTDEIILAGTTAAPGTQLTIDSKMKFVKSGTNATWVPGETVVYDSANTCLVPSSCRYVAGKFFNDTIVAGAAPLNNTSLNSDTKLKFFDANHNARWDIGEQVFYDTNNDSVYQTGEPIAAGFQAPSTGAVLASDIKIKYFETGGDTRWDPGESVVYDNDSSGTFTIGDTVIYGAVPGIGTILTTDSYIKYLDSSSNTVWNAGEPVIYDSNSNGLYDSGEPVIVSSSPAPGSPTRTVTHVFYRVYSGGTWQTEQRLTTQPSNDVTPSITQTLDGRIWITWAGERQGGTSKQIILASTTTNGLNWTLESQITSVTTYGDVGPSISQDRNGTIWMVWGRNVPCSCGKTVFESDLYDTYSTDNGLTWAPVTSFTSTTGQDEIQPSIVQLSDKNLYIFYSTIICGGSTCTVNIYYFKTQILVHSARMNGVTTKNATSINAVTIRGGQTLQLNASVTNTGDYTDTLVFWAKANSTLLPHTSVTVLSGQSMVITINWITSGFKPGRYTVTGNVTDSNSESVGNLADNYMVPFTILIRPAGDVNSDCVVNIIDLVLVAGSFGKSAGQPGFNPLADLNNDGTIDILDLSIVGGTFGQTC